ncbi:hypothetical protein D3874_01945 [Oleomonas cavernae]|uniref:Flagellar FliJ protein n=1 Tax=Oleomonas cavernae TaxID=2320859 RepID=A0A418WTR0_9PROT|nr:flagellar FliJ family protein [Oleomonas cavernae]RJF94615.1 hypothetical protein D3874_01945 [Oleomonas cavernae]
MRNVRGLRTLIQLHQRQLDEKRRVLAELEQLRAELDHKVAALDAEVARERLVADNLTEGARQFAAYLSGARLRRETLVRSIDELVEQIELAANTVAAAFQEVKRYEIAVDLKERQRRQAVAQAEQGELDEIALVQHRRRGRRLGS